MYYLVHLFALPFVLPLVNFCSFLGPAYLDFSYSGLCHQFASWKCLPRVLHLGFALRHTYCCSSTYLKPFLSNSLCVKKWGLILQKHNKARPNLFKSSVSLQKVRERFIFITLQKYIWPRASWWNDSCIDAQLFKLREDFNILIKHHNFTKFFLRGSIMHPFIN